MSVFWSSNEDEYRLLTRLDPGESRIDTGQSGATVELISDVCHSWMPENTRTAFLEKQPTNPKGE